MTDAPKKTKLPFRFGDAMLGVFDLARGRAAGLRHFGGTPEAVLAALTPMAAFALVGLVVAVMGHARNGAALVAATVVVLVAPLVLSFELARLWGRAAQWPRFAVAYCWCQWAGPIALVAMLFAVSLLMAAGLDGETALGLATVALSGYALWLHWFLARHALALSRWRAALMVLLVSLGSTVLIELPQLAVYLANGSPPA